MEISKENIENTVEIRNPIAIDMLNIDSIMTDEEGNGILDVVNEFRGVFATNLREIGSTDRMTADIVDNNIPVRSVQH